MGGSRGTSRVIMEPRQLQRTLSRMAHEILERHGDAGEVVLVGVRTRGVPLARRLAALAAEAGGTLPRVGALDITLYRDDLTAIAPHPVIKGTEIPVPIDGRVVVIVDDVLFTGRTVRAALDEIVDFGRPARIELAVVVDRGHRELPIRPDYVGKTLPTQRGDNVLVRLAEEDGEDGVLLVTPPRRPTTPRTARGPVRPKGGRKSAR